MGDFLLVGIKNYIWHRKIVCIFSSVMVVKVRGCSVARSSILWAIKLPISNRMDWSRPKCVTEVPFLYQVI